MLWNRVGATGVDKITSSANFSASQDVMLYSLNMRDVADLKPYEELRTPLICSHLDSIIYLCSTRHFSVGGSSRSV